MPRILHRTLLKILGWHLKTFYFQSAFPGAP